MKTLAIRSGIAVAVLLLAMPAVSAQDIGPGDTGGVTVNPDGDSGFGSGELGLGNDGGGGMLDLGLREGGTARIIDFNGDGVLDLNDGDILDVNGNGIVDDHERVNADLFGEGMDGEAQLAVNFENKTQLWLMLFGPGEGGDEAQADAIEMVPAQPGIKRGETRVTVSGSGRRALRCFAPDATQIDHLLGRNSYDAGVTDSWSSAAEVTIIPVRVCAEARTGMEAVIDTDANMGALRDAVDATTNITSSLEPRFEVEDVLAVDSSGANLTVYVY